MSMGKSQMCLLFFVLLLILASLALLVASIVTDFWYEVDATDDKITNSTVKKLYSYRFGMWRKCYTQGIPAGETRDRQGDCVFIYKDYIKRAEDKLSTEDMRYIHLQRSWVALLITAAGVQLFTVLALICGLWPGDCKTIRKATLYLIAAIFSLLAAMSGIASGICFIALRDLDVTSKSIYPEHTTQNYLWSFMLAWIGTGLCLVEGFFFLCLLKVDYDDIEGGKYTTM